MTLPELLELHRRLFPTWDAQFERHLLDRFGLAGNTKRLMRLSKGQRQQALLLCAVCHRPELLLLDEPASGLDPAVRREFLETAIQLLNREGSTILFSSHHMGDVERLGGRVLLLDRGAIRLDSDVDTLREAHCLAVIPASLVADDAVLRRLEGCRGVRRVQGTWHAVYAGTPDAIDRRLRATLNSDTIQCTALPLEELFIELVGGAPGSEAAA
jgi:ABC-2 type transport system ATP-binding protein